MLKDKLNILKEKFKNNDEGNNKRKIENLVVFIVILIITIIVINSIWNSNKKSSKNTNEQTNNTAVLARTNDTSANGNSEEEQLENKLKTILSKINGVGNVDVLLTYSQTSQVMAMYNEDNTKSDTEETDKQGGNRKISESSIKKEVIYQEIDGEKIPITQSIIKPKIEGAIITAKGAGNMEIKTNIIQAVEAATGLATHKIQVFESIM